MTTEEDQKNNEKIKQEESSHNFAKPADTSNPTDPFSLPIEYLPKTPLWPGNNLDSHKKIINFSDSLKHSLKSLSEVLPKITPNITSSLIPKITPSIMPTLTPTLNLLFKHQSEISDLESEIKNILIKNEQLQGEASLKDEKINELNKKVLELSHKQKLGYLLSQVNDFGQKILLESEEFRNKFYNKENQKAFVVSIDLRRSTELMLKAKSPEHFEKFISELCESLSEIIKENFGIFDKFTGDGILAYFPLFYSGEDAGLFALKASIDSHKIFSNHYEKHRSSFQAVLKNAGLGIGIDFGVTKLVNLINSHTVIGVPVVYACRMSSHYAGSTVLNQSAYDELKKQNSIGLKFTEITLPVKNEDDFIGYLVESTGDDIKPKQPLWLKEIKED